jgi:hypothetical protein
MMPPRARHRIDVLLVPEALGHEPDRAAFEAILSGWESSGRVRDGSLIRGGFRRVWLDVPGHVALYANQQGGYYVRCPVSQGNIARAFSRAVQAWRAGGERQMHCPECGQEHPLEAVVLAPPGAFARGAVVFSDVGSLDVGPAVQQELQEVLGESRLIVRRTG